MQQLHSWAFIPENENLFSHRNLDRNVYIKLICNNWNEKRAQWPSVNEDGKTGTYTPQKAVHQGTWINTDINGNVGEYAVNYAEFFFLKKPISEENNLWFFNVAFINNIEMEDTVVVARG